MVKVIHCTFVLDASNSVFLSSSKTAGLIETKFYVEPLWDGEMKICSWDFGQIIKIFAMSIYGKNPLKIFFTCFERPKTLKLGIQHWGL